MWIKSSQLLGQDIPESKVTPRSVFESRRAVLKGLTGAGLSLGALGAHNSLAQSSQPANPSATKLPPLIGAHSSASGAYVLDKPTSLLDASSSWLNRKRTVSLSLYRMISSSLLNSLFSSSLSSSICRQETSEFVMFPWWERPRAHSTLCHHTSSQN